MPTWFRIVPTCVFIYQHSFHCRVGADLKDEFAYVLLAARAMKSENCQLCYEPVTTENYLFPAHTDHYVLRK